MPSEIRKGFSLLVLDKASIAQVAGMLASCAKTRLELTILSTGNMDTIGGKSMSGLNENDK